MAGITDTTTAFIADPAQVAIFDGLDGGLEKSIELQGDYFYQSISNLRLLQYQDEEMFGINIAGRLSIFDDNGVAQWSSDILSMTVEDLWMLDTDEDGDDELLVTMSGGVVIYDLPSTTPVTVFLVSVASSLLEDIDGDESPELVLGKESGAIQVINPFTFETEANYILPSGADSLSFVSGLLGSNFLVGAGNNATSHLNLNNGRATLVATVPGESFGTNLKVSTLDKQLDILIGSDYAVHHLRLSPDIIFKSGLE